MARALTGWRSDYATGRGDFNFRYDPTYHDPGNKEIFGTKAAYDWRDACRLCVEHALHPSFFVAKLWSYFVATAPDAATRAGLEALYWNNGFAVQPVVEAILMHPDLHAGPAMVKPPVVFAAGLLRALGRGVDTTAWTALADQSGQRLFYPPNVAGWDDAHWLDTSTLRGRWLTAGQALADRAVPTAGYDTGETPPAALDRALNFWGGPPISNETRDALSSFAANCLPSVMTTSQKSAYRAMRQNALRHLVATAPDAHTC
jgi:uncharacterized protein (DUF1800 family)